MYSKAGCPGGSFSKLSSTLILDKFLLILISYFWIGYFYNRYQGKGSGLDSIPNRKFWFELIVLSKVKKIILKLGRNDFLLEMDKEK
jgi:hypothetical protein